MDSKQILYRLGLIVASLFVIVIGTIGILMNEEQNNKKATPDTATEEQATVSTGISTMRPVSSAEPIQETIITRAVTPTPTIEVKVEVEKGVAVTPTPTAKPAKVIKTAPISVATENNANSTTNNTNSTSILTKSKGVNNGPSGRETYYNLNMSGVIALMRNLGYSESEYPYWVREDGVKMLGDYVMVAANLSIRPKGTILPCSLGMAIVCDTGGFARHNTTQLDIAVNW